MSISTERARLALAISQRKGWEYTIGEALGAAISAIEDLETRVDLLEAKGNMPDDVSIARCEGKAPSEKA